MFLCLQAGPGKGCTSEKTEESRCDCWPSGGSAIHWNGERDRRAAEKKYRAGDTDLHFKVCVSHKQYLHYSLKCPDQYKY